MAKRNKTYKKTETIPENTENIAVKEWRESVSMDIEKYMPKFGRQDEITTANPNSSLRFYAAKLPYVMFGHDNLYPVRVLDYSTKNHNISRASNDFVAMLRNCEYTLETQNAKRLLELLKIEKLIERVAWDLVILNGMSVEVVNMPDVLGRMRTVALNHIPFANIRMSKANSYQNTEGFYSAEDWTVIDLYGRVKYYGNINREEYEVKTHIPYAQKWANSVFVDYEFHPSSRFYPVADSECVFNQAEISGQAVTFHLSYLKNGVIGSIMLSIPTPPMNKADFAAQSQAIIEQAEKNWQGAQNGGKPFIYLSPTDVDGNRQDPILSGFPQNGDDKRHLDLMKDIDAQTLFGLGYINSFDGGNLGKAEAMDMAYKLMEYNQVASLRKKIENFVNTIIRNNGIVDKFALPFTPPTLTPKEFNQTYTALPTPTSNP